MERKSLGLWFPSKLWVSLLLTTFLQIILGPKCILANYQNTAISIFEAVSIGQYQSYGSVRLLRFEVPKATELANWTFYATKSSADCPTQILQVHLQHEGFPVINPLNETFPSDFVLDGSSLYNISVASDVHKETFLMQNPLAGNWFAAVFGTGKTEVVKKLTDKSCTYRLAANLTVTDKEYVEDLMVAQMPFTVKLTLRQAQSFFRFFLSKETWAYEITLKDCQVSGTKVPSCPIEVLSRSQALPTNQNDSNYINCSLVQDKICQLTVIGPKINHFQYLVFEKHTKSTDDVTFHLSVTTKDAGEGGWLSGNMPHKMFRISEVGTDFRVTYALQATQMEYVENIFYVPSQAARLFLFDVVPMEDSGGTLRFRVMFNDTHLLNNTNYFTNISVCISKDVVPVHDSGVNITCEQGTDLTLSSVGVSTAETVRYFPYPRSGSWYIAMQSLCYSKDQYGNITIMDCRLRDIGVKFDLQVSPCVDGKCGKAGYCNLYYKGVLAFSVCSCRAKYRGYGCSDGSLAKADDIQLLNTLLLTLSNLFFLPSIGAAIYKRHYTEALVYFSNMFFSTFYHACDSGGMSLYITCIMPYHVMSYCDFFLSIMSFWVTLVAIAELRQPLYSLAHILGAIVLSMGVEWKEHGILPYIAPICTGVAIVIISWFVRSRRRRRFYPGWRRCLFMLPGFLLAGTGLCIFGFFETDDNYPYVHSVWHFSVSLSIIFFLPPRQHKDACHTDSGETSSNESLMEELTSPIESVSLIFAGRGEDNMAATMTSADKDDDVVLLD